MNLEFSIVQLITICATVNSVIFCFLILDKKKNTTANRFLALLIFCLCMTFTPYMLDNSVWHEYRWLAWLPFSFSYWIGPALFFYVKTLTVPNFRLNKTHFWHFSPIVLNYLHSVYHVLPIRGNPFPMFHHVSELLESGAVVSILIYMWISHRNISHFQKRLLHNVSNIDLINLGWIKMIIWVVSGMFGFILIYLIVSTTAFGKESMGLWNAQKEILLIGYSIVLYWVSISGYKQSPVAAIIEMDSTNEILPKKEVTKIQLLDENMKHNHLYRNPELSLELLSKTTGIPPRTISNLINNHLNLNFYQFVNDYRIEEVKTRLVDPKFSHWKILNIAMDAGFNSKASFNRIFKHATGVSPKVYKEKNS